MPSLKQLKDKKIRRENKQQKQQTERNRDSGRAIMSALQNAELSLMGVENPESREVFKNITKTFIQYVDNAPVIGQYDVVEIDQLILEMIEFYSQALKSGDLDTAKLCVERIRMALTEFRKELTTLELPRMDVVLDDRIEKLKDCKTLLKTSRAVHTNRVNVEDKEKEYIKFYNEYNDLFQNVEEYVQTHQSQYEKLLELRPGIDAVPEDAQELNTMLANLDLISDQVDDLKSTMEIFKNEYNTQLSTLNSLETMLTLKNGLLSKEEEQQMNDMIDRYHTTLQDAVLETERLQELQEKRHIAIGQLLSSMSVGKAAMKHQQKYEAIRRRRQQILEDEARGRALQNEIENERQVLTN